MIRDRGPDVGPGKGAQPTGDPCPHDYRAHPGHHRDVPAGEPTRRAPLLARSGRGPLRRPAPVPGAAEPRPRLRRRGGVGRGGGGPSRQRGGLPLASPASLRHVGSRSPTKVPGSWPRARRWPLPMQRSRLCSGSPGWPRPPSRAAGFGSGRAACSPGRTWKPRSTGLCREPDRERRFLPSTRVSRAACPGPTGWVYA
jgi:hypothetical protein